MGAVDTTNPFLSEEDKLEVESNQTNHLVHAVNTRLVLASYNIRYAVGRHLISSGILRKVGLNPPFRRNVAIEKNIAAAADAFSKGILMPRPHVIALQEADKCTARSGGLHVARELAHSLEMNLIHAPAGIPRGVLPRKRQWWLDFEEQIGLYDEGDTGVALLSRLALSDIERIDLPWHECAWRPRVAVAATISVGKTDIRIFNAHIDPHPEAKGQLEQLERMVEQADKVTGPTIIMGDFNTLSNQKCRDIRSFLEARGYTSPFPTGTETWRGAGLRFHADWIFSRDVRVTGHGVGRPLNVSDHWPIWAEIDLTGS